MVNSLFRAKSWNSNLNIVMYFLLVLTIIGIVWLSLNDVTAGQRYSQIFFGGISLMVLSFFFLKENQAITLKNLIVSPFTIDTQVSGAMFYIGGLVPLTITLLTKIFGGGFNIAQVMIPLSSQKVINGITQSFAVAEASASPFWKWFVITFVAGSIEEFVFGFVLVLVGSILGMLLWTFVFNQKNLNSKSARSFYLISGLLVSGLLFGGAHSLNATYTTTLMFVLAIGFRTVMNYSIYVLGLFLTFTTGYHIMNNAIYYWNTFGAQATIDALLSPGGIIVLSFLLLLTFFILRDIDPVIKKIKQIFTNLG